MRSVRKPRVQSSSSSTRTFFPPLLCSLSPPPCRLSLLPIRLVSCNESAVYTPHARTHTHRTRVGGRKRRKKHRQRTVEKSPWKATTITRVATWRAVYRRCTCCPLFATASLFLPLCWLPWRLMEVWEFSRTRPTSSRTSPTSLKKRWRDTASIVTRTRERIPKDAAARFSLETSVAIPTEAKKDSTMATVTEVQTDPRVLGNRPTSWSGLAEQASRIWTESRNGEETTWISSDTVEVCRFIRTALWQQYARIYCRTRTSNRTRQGYCVFATA